MKNLLQIIAAQTVFQTLDLLLILSQRGDITFGLLNDRYPTFIDPESNDMYILKNRKFTHLPGA